VAPAVEASLPKASMVEGECTAQTQPSSSSSHSPQETNLVCLLLIGDEVEGSTIPEVCPLKARCLKPKKLPGQQPSRWR
jgi:hypothetical protein